MPAWLLTVLLRYALPLIIQWLQKKGYIDAAESLAARGAVALCVDLKALKVTPDYTGTGNDPLPPVTTNLTTKDGTKVGG